MKIHKKKQILLILVIVVTFGMVSCSNEKGNSNVNNEAANNQQNDANNENENNDDLDQEKEDVEKLESIIESVRISEVALLTGQDSVNETEEKYDVGGTDLGSIFELDDQLYFVFGDTFGADSVFPPGTGYSSNWRSNVVAYTSDMDPTDGITLDGFLEEDGKAKEIIPSNKVDGNHLTSIPTYGVAVDGNMYLYYMAVDFWGDAGEWFTSHAGVYKSEDKGEEWEKIEDLEWDVFSNFTQVAIVKPDQNPDVLNNDIYFYGVEPGRYSNIQLMKVNENDIEDISKYMYFTGVDSEGDPQWSNDESEATDVIETTAGELSVVWNEGLDRWILTYINGTTTNIDIAEAENPWGPWTEPRAIVYQSEYPGLYGSYMHPSFIKDDGKSIYFVMSRWGTYQAYIMKAELELE